jgi:hypothetical protein
VTHVGRTRQEWALRVRLVGLRLRNRSCFLSGPCQRDSRNGSLPESVGKGALWSTWAEGELEKPTPAQLHRLLPAYCHPCPRWGPSWSAVAGRGKRLLRGAGGRRRRWRLPAELDDVGFMLPPAMGRAFSPASYAAPGHGGASSPAASSPLARRGGGRRAGGISSRRAGGDGGCRVGGVLSKRAGGDGGRRAGRISSRGGRRWRSSAGSRARWRRQRAQRGPFPGQQRRRGEARRRGGAGREVRRVGEWISESASWPLIILVIMTSMICGI